jgi:lysophospholipase L1-like esterase
MTPVLRPLTRAAVAVVLLASAPWLHAQTNPDPNRFAKEIAAFDAEDQATPPPVGAVLFVGSSSIRYWDVAKAFPALKTIRRGYGGSHVSDTQHFADRLIARYAPRLVVFYAGDADVAAGKTAAQIAGDTEALVAWIHKAVPKAGVVVIGTKPSPLHWAHMATIRDANARLKASLAKDPNAAYTDAEAALLGPEGQPRADFYQENRLNLNDRGYEAWTAALKPVIDRMAARFAH